MFNDNNNCITIEKVTNGWIVRVASSKQNARGQTYVATTIEMLGELTTVLARNIKD